MQIYGHKDDLYLTAVFKSSWLENFFTENCQKKAYISSYFQTLFKISHLLKAMNILFLKVQLKIFYLFLLKLLFYLMIFLSFAALLKYSPLTMKNHGTRQKLLGKGHEKKPFK